MFHYLPRAGTGSLGFVASSGWIGVDIFFVLSGFLITRILYDQRGARNYFRNFYARRVLRLFPLYYFIFFLVLLLTPLLHIQWRPGHFAMLFYGANLVLPFDVSLGLIGPFDIFHVWSLAVEEQFYLIWPWVVGSRLSKGTLLKICGAGIVIAPLLRLALLQVHFQPWFIYQSLPTRMDSLLVGAALALMPLPSLRTARMCGAASLVMCGLAVWQGHSMFFLSRPIQGIGFSALAVLSGSLLVLSYYPETIVHRVASWAVFRFYGKYSYGLYLWHYLFSEQEGLMLHLLQRRLRTPLAAPILNFAVALLCSTLLAIISYRVIERPFLKLKRRFEY